MKIDDSKIRVRIMSFDNLLGSNITNITLYYPMNDKGHWVTLKNEPRSQIENTYYGLLSYNELMKSLYSSFYALKEELSMTKLTTKVRKKIPSVKFGIPSERKYPMEDKAHARNAKARASEMEHKGKLSSSMKAKIDRKADKVLGKTKKK